MRLCSFAQKSTRYCDEKDDIEFIEPVWNYEYPNIFTRIDSDFEVNLKDIEYSYKHLRSSNWQPQQAREILPNALKTEIIVRATIEEWEHIFELRTAPDAHPQIIDLMNNLKSQFEKENLI